jgi:aminopeptidase N
MEDKAADRFHPEWKMSLQTMASREQAMRVDAGAGTHPVITPIRDVFAAANAFDAITYQKGEAVIRMLERYVGEDAFRAGIRAYIAHNAYGNTTTDQLWSELERVSPRPVSRVAHDFTLQPGVPLIRAAADPAGLRLTQSRYATEPSQMAGSWLAPVSAAALTGAAQWQGLVDRATPQTVALPIASGVLVNAGQSGYFRTLYAPELWAALDARFATLSPIDQLGLLYDARAVGETAMAPIGDFLALAKTAANVREPVVLSNLAGELAALVRAYPAGDKRVQAYRAYARARLSPVLARVGWDPRAGEDDNSASLRGDLIQALGELDDPAVTAEAKRRFEASLPAPEKLTGALRNAIQAVVARHADPALWEALQRRARDAASTSERNRLYRLLGAAKDPALVDRALALSLSGDISPTTAPAIIAAVAGLYPDKAFDFAVAHRPQVEALLEPDSRTMFFTNLARNSTDAGMDAKLQAFSRTVPPSSRGEVAKAEAEIARRRLFAERGVPAIDRWLAAHPD